MQGRTEQEIIAELEQVPYGDLVLELFYKNVKPESIRVRRDSLLAQTTHTSTVGEPPLWAVLSKERRFMGKSIELGVYQARSVDDLMRLLEQNDIDLLSMRWLKIYTIPTETGHWGAARGGQYRYELRMELSRYPINLGNPYKAGSWTLKLGLEALELGQTRIHQFAPLQHDGLVNP